MEEKGADTEKLKELLGKGRAKMGIFEGDMKEGELEIGQISSMLTKEENVEEIFKALLSDYNNTLKTLKSDNFRME